MTNDIRKILQRKLLEMFFEDQNAIKKGNNRLWLRIRRKNAEALKAIIRESGWPTIRQAGRESALAAWLIAQHADHDLKFQKRCLVLIRVAAAKKQAEPKNLAYLTDRVLVNSGQPQIFGTQYRFNRKKGNLEPKPIRNLRQVDKRRAEHGLEPLEDYLKSVSKHLRTSQKKKRLKSN